jgi:hypothetical protein
MIFTRFYPKFKKKSTNNFFLRRFRGTKGRILTNISLQMFKKCLQINFFNDFSSKTKIL